jgi:hypothetical protein
LKNIKPNQIGILSKPAALRLKNLGVTTGEARDLLKGLEGDGSHVFGLTRGQASMVDLALAAMGLTGSPVDLTVWTWVVADYELMLVDSMIDDGRVSSFRLVCDAACVPRRPGFVERVRERFGNDAVRLTASHAKIAMVRGPKADILIRGSMNFNQNKMIEQFDATWSFELCDWFEGVCSQMWDLGSEATENFSRDDLVARIDELQ